MVRKLLDSCIDESTEFGENVKLGFGVVIEKNCKIGNNTMIGHYSILRPNTIIGDDCKIGHFVVFEGDCKIGNRVSIHPHIIITKGVIIEDEVFMAGHTITMNDSNMSYLRNEFKPNPPKIKKRARISGGCKILPGIVIGEESIVGCGSIVTKSIPDNETWYGTPAKKRNLEIKDA